MRSSIVWLLAAAGIAAQAQTAESPIEGYTVDSFSWEVESTPGQTVVLDGTVEQVLSQLRELNPNYDTEFNLSALDETSENEQDLAARSLSKRDDVKCGVFPSARRADVENGIKYLRGISGQPQRGPGPGSCGQVSCSWSSAIWWCNDNTVTKVLPSFNNIADGAQLIQNTCLHGGQTYSGQDFHTDNWNVIVRFSKC